MIPEIGQFALVLAALLMVVQGTLPLVGASKGISAWMTLSRRTAQGAFFFLALALGCLIYSFIVNDFSVLNVANNSNTKLPVIYRIAASWGSHEGSILMWVFMLGLWSCAVSIFSKHLPEEMTARVLGVMGLVTTGLLFFLLLTSNPFDRIFPVPLEGRDLNPLLQDIGMILHPPMLYMGYVGFSVAFAFAIAALLGGRLDATWARWSRPWTTLAWCFLTVGILIGSWWAYYELGWGGWWFWDPVENASLMPWLVGTALIHSLAVTEKRGTFKVWTVLLAICTFSLSLLGTFLVRSGVLTSVHAFATDPQRGMFILTFLALVIGGSLALFAFRAPKVGTAGTFKIISRESALLANNVLLTVACGTVLLGTLYPLFLDALKLGKISVGPPYFEAVFVPLMAPLVFLMGVGAVARWKESTLPDLWARLRWAAVITLVAAVALPFILGRTSPTSVALLALGFAMAFWIVTASLAGFFDRVKHVEGGFREKLARQPRSFWGMFAAHIGVAVFIIGVTVVKGFEAERDVRMMPGDTVSVGGYTFRFESIEDRSGPNYHATRGTFELSKDGKAIRKLYPEKRVYFAHGMPMTEAAIDSGFFGDRYVSLGEPINDGKQSWSARVYHKPFVTWIWYGSLLMTLGGLLAISDRRYRVSARRETAKPSLSPLEPAKLEKA
ncbi:MAG: heme lyase CcmF/NrfE family subunit [Burkholderiales bacterium]|jgi:cytochrome c-type biogenesis protein CcmF|nr:heme lyase CcmF/NrfE family subunit [Burkholderiales bacterium]